MVSSVAMLPGNPLRAANRNDPRGASMNISHSKVELYTQCPYKYQLSYVEKWSPDKTFTPLLFGSAIDDALNYVLTQTMDGHKPDFQRAIQIFNTKMNAWKGQNELSYFKNEAPEFDPNGSGQTFEEIDDQEKQFAVFSHLINVGHSMIEVYLLEVLPLFKRIISVQTRRNVPNESGDNLILITDFTAELLDGRVVTFDNKTSSDIKKYYGPSSVRKSQQLAIYTEFEPTRLAGYIALQKKLVDGKIKWHHVVDEIPTDAADLAFDKVDAALNAIKRQEFPKNEKSCFAYGKKCDYWQACKRGDYSGLVKR